MHNNDSNSLDSCISEIGGQIDGILEQNSKHEEGVVSKNNNTASGADLTSESLNESSNGVLDVSLDRSSRASSTEHDEDHVDESVDESSDEVLVF